MTVDQANGDIYVMEAGSGKLARFDSTGAPKTFTATGTNKLSGFTTSPEQRSEVSIDNSGGTTDGSIFVTRFQNKIDIFDREGVKVGELNGSGDFLGSFFSVCGVAVDQTNGDVYVGDNGLGGPGVIYRLKLKAGATFPLSDEDYESSPRHRAQRRLLLDGCRKRPALRGQRSQRPDQRLRRRRLRRWVHADRRRRRRSGRQRRSTSIRSPTRSTSTRAPKINVLESTSPYAKLNEITGGGLAASRASPSTATTHAVYAANGTRS